MFNLLILNVLCIAVSSFMAGKFSERGQESFAAFNAFAAFVNVFIVVYNII